MASNLCADGKTAEPRPVGCSRQTLLAIGSEHEAAPALELLVGGDVVFWPVMVQVSGRNSAQSYVADRASFYRHIARTLAAFSGCRVHPAATPTMDAG